MFADRDSFGLKEWDPPSRDNGEGRPCWFECVIFTTSTTIVLIDCKRVSEMIHRLDVERTLSSIIIIGAKYPLF